MLNFSNKNEDLPFAAHESLCALYVRVWHSVYFYLWFDRPIYIA